MVLHPWACVTRFQTWAAWGAVLSRDRARAHAEATGSAGSQAPPALLLDCWEGEPPGRPWLLVGGGLGPGRKACPGHRLAARGLNYTCHVPKTPTRQRWERLETPRPTEDSPLPGLPCPGGGRQALFLSSLGTPPAATAECGLHQPDGGRGTGDGAPAARQVARGSTAGTGGSRHPGAHGTRHLPLPAACSLGASAPPSGISSPLGQVWVTTEPTPHFRSSLCKGKRTVTTLASQPCPPGGVTVASPGDCLVQAGSAGRDFSAGGTVISCRQLSHNVGSGGTVGRSRCQVCRPPDPATQDSS